MGPIVDVHAHFLPDGVIRALGTGRPWHGTLVERGERGGPLLITGDHRMELGTRGPGWIQSPEERLAAMEAAGVDVQIVSLCPVLFRYGIGRDDAVAAAREVNDELHHWTTRWPGRYLGFATLPLQDVDATVAELHRAMTELGFAGAAVGTNVDGANWDEPALLPVLAAAEELGALLFFHPALLRVAEIVPRHRFSNLIGNPFETTVAIGSLIFGGVLDRHPALKAVFAHGGGFACADAGRFDHGYTVTTGAADQAAKLPSDYLRGLWYDSLTHSEPALRYLLDNTAPTQVVLGTDYPADMGVRKPREWVESCALLTPAERQGILSDNIARLISVPVA